MPRVRISDLRVSLVFAQKLIVSPEFVSLITEHISNALHHQPIAVEIRISHGISQLESDYTRRLRLVFHVFNRLVCCVELCRRRRENPIESKNRPKIDCTKKRDCPTDYVGRQFFLSL